MPNIKTKFNYGNNYNRTCVLCGKDITYRSPQAKACERCAVILAHRYSQARNEQLKQERLKKRLEAQPKVEGYKELPCQELLSETEIAVPKKYERKQLLVLPLRCQQCGQERPTSGFAPIFSKTPLHQLNEAVEDIVLLCNDCYDNWEEPAPVSAKKSA